MSMDSVPHMLKVMWNLWIKEIKVFLGGRNRNLKLFPPKQ